MIGRDSCAQDVQRALIGFGSCPRRPWFLVAERVCVRVCVCIKSEVTTLPNATNALELMFIPLIKFTSRPSPGERWLEEPRLRARFRRLLETLLGFSVGARLMSNLQPRAQVIGIDAIWSSVQVHQK